MKSLDHARCLGYVVQCGERNAKEKRDRGDNRPARNHMVILGVVGAKNSGKTTVMEELIGRLKNTGLRVATVKHTSHRHRFDTAGKDSYRHRHAGAGLTIAVSREEIAVFSQADIVSVPQVQDLARGQFDIWLVEGDRQSPGPKILVTRNMADPPDSLPENIIATIGQKRINETIPHFEESDYSGLASFVIGAFLKEER
ncbi:MAG: molybdopterin-guanine dinucleotide biosynthesis protein B [Chitinivibrionia bacterium]|nr:molybdopterin-guanine dinucleotide biosynthesis protein B [Chitinivibrionia bacterium]